MTANAYLHHLLLSLYKTLLQNPVHLRTHPSECFENWHCCLPPSWLFQPQLVCRSTNQWDHRSMMFVAITTDELYQSSSIVNIILRSIIYDYMYACMYINRCRSWNSRRMGRSRTIRRNFKRMMLKMSRSTTKMNNFAKLYMVHNPFYLFLILQRTDVVRKRVCARPCMIIYMPAHTPYTSSIPNGAKCAANVKILF